MYATGRSLRRVKGSLKSPGVIQNPHALARCGERNNVLSFPDHAEGSYKDMVQQFDAQLHQYLQGAERVVCLALYRGAEV